MNTMTIKIISIRTINTAKPIIIPASTVGLTRACINSVVVVGVDVVVDCGGAVMLQVNKKLIIR